MNDTIPLPGENEAQRRDANRRHERARLSPGITEDVSESPRWAFFTGNSRGEAKKKPRHSFKPREG
jgi:hypothetical protein